MASGDQRKIPEIKYEYLDHTADVQLHSWGDNLQEAFEQCATAMFGYMTTDYSRVEMTDTQEIEVEADDMQNLLFHFLDEWLFLFSAEPFFIPRVVEVTEFDKENFKVKARGYGEEFDISKHPQGTEVKAITYSNMQIHDVGKLEENVQQSNQCEEHVQLESSQCEEHEQLESDQFEANAPLDMVETYYNDKSKAHVFVIIDI